MTSQKRTSAQLRALEILNDNGELIDADSWKKFRTLMNQRKYVRYVNDVPVDFVDETDLMALQRLRAHLGANEVIPFPENPQVGNTFEWHGQSYTWWPGQDRGWVETHYV